MFCCLETATKNIKSNYLVAEMNLSQCSSKGESDVRESEKTSKMNDEVKKHLKYIFPNTQSRINSYD